MFIPIGHDRTTVQRLPVVTISLIILNLIFFLMTFVAGRAQEDRLMESIKKLMTLAREYPDAKISEPARDRLERLHLKFADSSTADFLLGEHEDRLSSEAASAQTEMDQLSAEFVRAYNEYWVFKYGFIPREHSGTILNYLTSIFLHGGWQHLIGNMLFLWLAGMAIEDLWGRGIFAAFYAFSGLAATLLHLGMNPGTTQACIGASGAIAGLMGAFMVRHFNARVRFAYFYLILLRPIYGVRDVPAYICLPFWLAQQLFFGWMTAAYNLSAGVAFWAHIGGFAFGAIVATVLYHGGIEQKYIAPKIEEKISFGGNPLVTKALEAMEKGDVQTALKNLRQVLQTQPESLEALNALTCVYQQTGQRAELDATYHRIIRLHLKNNDKESALETYGLLLDTYAEGEEKLPLPAREWMTLCDYLKELNRPEEAAGEYEKLAHAYPADVFAVRALICAAELNLQGQFNLARARELFERAAAMNPQAPAYQNRIAAGLTQTAQARPATHS